jgi:nitronate monooxygenase
MLGVEHPIICAPMAGGPSTPELAAAVSNAGGLGSLGTAYLTPDQITQAIARTRELTTKPFAVNLFAGGWLPLADHPVEPMLNLLRPIHNRLGLPEPQVPNRLHDPFPEQFEAVLEARPPIFSFTFGVPKPDAMTRLRSHGILTIGTATSLLEAMVLKDAGVDAIVAQGEEAGGHRGTFTTFTDETMVPTLDLVRQIASVASIAPVIASGGIMDGHGIARALAKGASAVQLGTAFLACPESGASLTYKAAVLTAESDTTIVTRAFSGRPARGIRNKFIDLAHAEPDAILPYPWQNALTRQMRTAATERNEPTLLSLWAGRGVARCRFRPAAELVRLLVQESQVQESRQPKRTD